MRTEVRRGRKFVEYQDDSLPVGTFVQEIGAHDVSYQDEQGVWLPADENWATDGLDGYIVKADKLNHKVRLKGAGGRAWYPRRNVASEYLTFGVPQYWTGSKWANFGFSGWSVEGKTITLNTRQNVTILVHSRWNGIKIDWVLANTSAPTRMRYSVALTGITEIAGVLFGADGTELGRLTPTTATDANGNELPCSGSYSNGYVEFSVDRTGGVYPIVVDPDFAGDTGDGYVQGVNGTYTIARSTSTGSTIAGDIYVGQRTGFFIYRGFLKFDTSSIPDTDPVTQVNLKLVCTYDKSVTDFDVQIVKQDWGALDLTNLTDRETAYDGCLAGTADSSIWRNTNGMSTNTAYTSGNLATDWVNKTGYTCYGLRSSRDYVGTQNSTHEYIYFGGSEHATAGYRPVLVVAYGVVAQNLTLTCAAGSYSLAGSAVTLTHTPASQNLTLACNAGSYSLTGTNATFAILRNYILACEAGGYALTGTNTALTSARTMACNAGSYTLTGTNADFYRALVMACEAGSYALTGSDVTLTVTAAGGGDPPSSIINHIMHYRRLMSR